MHGGLDIIGDVHGCCRTLEELLSRLGYRPSGHAWPPLWSHPTRRAVFLGDFIDRGRHIVETLYLIRRMVSGGAAFAVCGNHELNAIHWHTEDGEGNPLRSHTPEREMQHEQSLIQFLLHGEDWGEWTQWFRELPLWLELPPEVTGSIPLRFVHACWDGEEMARFLALRDAAGRALLSGDAGSASLTEAGVLESGARGGAAFESVERILKGPEIPGVRFADKEGTVRKRMRVRWWKALPARWDELMMAGRAECAQIREQKKGDVISDPSVWSPVPVPLPVFFGHYWLDPGETEILSPRLACLDFSVAKGGRLGAYRWNRGDRSLVPGRIVSVPADPEDLRDERG